MLGIWPRIKVITHNAGLVSIEDDPSFPYTLEASLQPPKFMTFAEGTPFHGSTEEYFVRGRSEGALCTFADENILNNPRLIRCTIKGPGTFIQFTTDHNT